MLNIRNAEEKKMIVAYYMVGVLNKNLGIENVWRIWCKFWKTDFVVDGKLLRMYNHYLVSSKTKARAKLRLGENIQEFKEYDDFLIEVYEWIKKNYDETKDRNANAHFYKKKLLAYRAECNRNIREIFNKSGLKEKGYKIKNHPSKKISFLAKYIILANEDGVTRHVKQGNYEEVIDYILNSRENERV